MKQEPKGPKGYLFWVMKQKAKAREELI